MCVRVILLSVLCMIHAATADAQQRTASGARIPDAVSFTRFSSADDPHRALLRSLPQQVDLSRFVPPAGDQGLTNTCTGWAVGYGLCSAIQADLQGDSALRGSPAPPVDRVFSPSFIYALALGSGKCNDDVRLADALSVATRTGCCPWSDLPFDTVHVDRDCLNVPAPARDQATRFRLMPASKLAPRSADALRQQLAAGNLIVFSAQVEDSFGKGGDAAGGSTPFTWRPSGFANSFSHAMLCMGYDDADQCFLMQNSWGSLWGLHGTFRMPYDVAERYITEAYAVQPVILAMDLVPPPAAPVGDQQGDRRLGTTLAEGQGALHQDVLFHAVDITGDADSLVLRVHDKATGELLHQLHLPLDQDRTVYHAGRAYEVEYERPVHGGRAARLKVVARDQVDDPALRKALRHVERITH